MNKSLLTIGLLTSLLLQACGGSGSNREEVLTAQASDARVSAPSVTLTADSSSVSSGQSVTLTWSATNARSCTASGAWSNTKTASGSESSAPLTAPSNTFTLTCSGAGGDGTASTTVAVKSQAVGQGSGNYSTTFDLVESPISEGGAWITGGTTGLKWTNPQTASGFAFGTQSGTNGFDDSIAHLSGFGPDQSASAVVARGSPNGVQEIELLLRFQITPNNARGYEVAISDSGRMWVVRFNGSLGDYTILASGLTTGVSAERGDVWYAEIVGTTITVKCNGTVVWTGTDATWSSGNPGIGFYRDFSNGPPNGNEQFGWTSFTATSLGSSPPPPAVTLSASPATLTSGQSATLNWSATNARSCVASGAWTGEKSTAGTQSTGALNSTATYTLTCSGDAGSAAQSTTIQVSAAVDTPPPSITLSASPSTIVSGGTSTLTWSVNGASSCNATGAWSGSKDPRNGSETTAALTQDSTFTLTCAGDGGSASQSTIVTVTAPPAAPSLTFTASPASITSGQSSTLSWSATNATGCTASGAWTGTKATSGSQSTGALTSNSTYTLTCNGSGGSVNQSATVNVSAPPPAPTLTLSASPGSITSGGSSTLTWSAANATSCTASGSWSGAKATSGSQSTGTLTSNSSYTLTCDGAGGSVTQTANVTVSAPPPAPTLTLSASPNPITSGGSSTLSWSSTNATSCTASGAWSGAKSLSGTQSTGTLSANSTFSLTCNGAGGSASRSVTIVVNQPPPAPTVSLSASPNSVTSGGTTTLTWSSTNATSCTASGAWSGTKATSGSESSASLTASSNTFTLTCDGSGGQGSGSATVSVTDPPPPPPPPSNGNYSTTFDLIENPISEGGAWVTGGTTGLNWSNPQTASGYAFGTQSGTNGFDDSIAHLKGFGPNQSATAVIARGSPNGQQEIELLLRFQITANNARGYEIDISDSGRLWVVRWNGPMGDYTILAGGIESGVSAESGDVWYAEMVGSTITIKCNGTVVWSGDDSTWSTGNPGIGFYRDDSNGPPNGNEQFGWTSFTAKSL